MFQQPKNVSLYRGYAGECAVNFFKKPPLLTLTGIALTYFVIFFILSKPIEKSTGFVWLLALILFVTHSFLSSKFALSSLKGYFGEGVFTPLVNSEDTIDYSIKLFICSLVYFVPIGVIYMILDKEHLGQVSQQIIAIQMGQEVPFSFLSGLLILLLIVFIALCLVCLPLAHLLILTTDSALDTWFPDQWVQFLKTRGSDAFHFSLSFFGSTFFFTSSLLVLSLGFGALSIPLLNSTAVLTFMVESTFFLSLSAMTILSGRLSGAFIFGAKLIHTEDEPEEKLVYEYEPEAPVTAKEYTSTVRHSSPRAKLSLNQRIQQVEDLSESNIPLAIKTLATIESEFGENTKTASCKLKLHLASGDKELSLQSAKSAILWALDSGSNLLAIDLYLSLGKWRLELQLKPDQCKTLGNFLRNENHFKDAAWNFYLYGKLSTHTESAEELILNMAKSVELEVNSQIALPLYRFILKYFPATEHREYIEKVIEYNKSH